MKVVCAFLFCLLAAITESHSHIIPDKYEVSYEYEALVSTSVEKPKLFSSSYRIRYQLTATNLEEHNTLVQIKNVTYSMNSGKGADTDSVFESIPAEAEHLQTSFIIIRDPEGSSTMIKTKKDEPLWSVNMKKGIASLLQVQIRNDTRQGAYAYGEYEYSTYGRCQTLNTMVPISMTRFNVEKIIETSDCMKLEDNFKRSFDVRQCEKSENYNPLSMISSNIYEMEEVGDSLFLNSIHGVNSIILSAFEGNSDGYSMMIRQKMDKINAIKVDQYPTVNTTTMKEHKLKISFNQQESDLLDLIGGRGHYDLEVITDAAVNLYLSMGVDLKNNLSFFNDDALETADQLMILLRILDQKHFEMLFGKLSNDSLLCSLFLQSLPVVGTSSAAVFIRDLIVNKKVENSAAKSMLQELPFHLVQPDRDLLKELTSLQKVVDSDLKSTIELMLASITSKVMLDDEDDPFVRKVAEEFIEKFKTSVKEDERVLYVNALINLNSENSIAFLTSIVKGDVKTSSLVRSLAIWGHRQGNSWNHIWEIFRDQTLRLEFRSAALDIIMRRVNAEQLLLVHQYMKEETEPDLYSLYYTNLVSISKSKAPCHSKMALDARRFLSAVRVPPALPYNGYNTYLSNLNEQYHFGLSLRTSLVGNPVMDHFTSLRIEHTSQIRGYELNQDIYHLIVSLNEDNYLTVLMIHSRNNQVISINPEGLRINPEDSILSFIQNMIFRLDYGTKTHVIFGFNFDNKMVFPTDLGTPAMFTMQMATKQKILSLFDSDDLGKNQTYYFDLKLIKNRLYGLKAYNPISDTWHGVRRNDITNMRLPLLSHLKHRAMLVLFESNFTTVINGTIEELKFETNSFSQVFIEGVTEKQTKYVQASYGKDHQKSKVIWEYDCPITLVKYQLAVFDCERPLTSALLSQLRNSLFDGENKDMKSLTLTKVYVMLRHFLTYSIPSPAPGRCGMRLTATPKFTRTTLSLAFTSAERLGIHINQTFDIGDKTMSRHLEVKPREDSARSLLKYIENFHANFTDMKGNKICFEREQIMTGLKEESVFIGYSAKNETSDCLYERPAINVTVLSEFKRRSTDTDDDAFEECRMSGKTILTCVAEQSYYDKYTYNINYIDGPNRYVELWNEFAKIFRNSFGTHSTRERLEKQGEPGKATIVIDYEPFSNDPNVFFMTPSENITYENIPIGENLFWKYIHSRETYQVEKWLDTNILLNPNDERYGECVIRGDYIFDTHGTKLPLNITTEWSTFFDYNVDYSFMDKVSVDIMRDETTKLQEVQVVKPKPLVSVRRNGTTKSLEVEVVWYPKENKHVLTIRPKENSVEITLNDKILDASSGYHIEEPISYKVTQKSAFIFLGTESTEYTPHLVVTGDSVEAVVRMFHQFTGLCPNH